MRFLNHSNIEDVLIKRPPEDFPRKNNIEIAIDSELLLVIIGAETYILYVCHNRIEAQNETY